MYFLASGFNIGEAVQWPSSGRVLLSHPRTGEASYNADAYTGHASLGRLGNYRPSIPMNHNENTVNIASSGLNHRGGSESHYPIRNNHGYENEYPTAIGIDTIGIIASDYQVSETAEVEVRRASNAGTGETTDRPLYRLGGDGRLIKGIRAYANIQNISVTIYGPEALYVETTLPRVLGPNNCAPVSTSFRLRMSLKAVQRRLQKFGITTDLICADITRLDICRNVHTSGKLPDYEPMLRRCSFPQTEVRRYEDGGYYWTNGSRELLIYAKGEEQGTAPLVQRLEYRLTQKRSVEAQIGTPSLRGLLADFDAVRRAYGLAVDKLLPDLHHLEDESPMSLRGGVLEMITAAKKQTSHAHSKTLQALGLQYLQERGAEDDFLSALEEEAGRMAASRYRDTFDKLAPIADLLSEEERTATDMLGELRRKLLP